MADIFNEVDEEVRRERLKQLWARYGNVIVAAAVLIVIAVGGWRAWQYWEARRAAETGAAFEAAANLATEGKSEDAIAAFARIAAEGTSGYRLLARFREAAELAERDRSAAVKEYDALSADASVPRALQDLAAIRAGLLLVDSTSYDELARRLEPLTANDRAFRHTARELLAVSAWRSGNVTAMRRWVDMITTDAQTPASTRARVEVLTAVGPGVGRG